MSEFASGTLTAKNIHLSFGSNHVLRGASTCTSRRAPRPPLSARPAQASQRCFE